MYISQKKGAPQRKEREDKSNKRGIFPSSPVTIKAKRCLKYLNINKK